MVQERDRLIVPLRVAVASLLVAGLVAAGAMSTDDQSATTRPRAAPPDAAAREGADGGEPDPVIEALDSHAAAEQPRRAATRSATRTSDTPTASAPPVPASGGAGGEIAIGIGYSSSASLAAACVALTANSECSQAEEADIKGWAEKTVAWVNANGGLGGRQVVPVYFEMDVTRQLRADDRAQMEQEMCARWTEDNRVFAMIPTTNMEGVLLECARRAGAVFVSTTSAESVVDAGRFAELGPVWYRPGWILADRREEIVVDALHDAGWFGDDARVGIMMHDRAENLRAGEVLKHALAARNIDIVSEVRYPDVVESPWSTYALKLQGDGVTHVLYGSGHSSGPVWFLAQQAESQGYEPKYGFGTDQEPNGVAAIVGSDIGSQSTVVGWSPFQDTGVDRYEPYPLNDADRLCHEIIGHRMAHPAYCDGLFFLKHVLDRAPDATLESFAATVETLGSSYQSPYTYASRFGPGRHDGAAEVAVLGWDDPCSCFKPSSPRRSAA